MLAGFVRVSTIILRRICCIPTHSLLFDSKSQHDQALFVKGFKSMTGNTRVKESVDVRHAVLMEALAAWGDPLSLLVRWMFVECTFQSSGS